MQRTSSTTLAGLWMSLVVFVPLAVAQEMPRTTKQNIKGAEISKTKQLQGTVVYVEGNRLVVRMSSGELRTFEPPESQRFNIDGREVGVTDLKPGTKLNATVTTTTTPITERTTTVGTGKVWYVSGNNVILTLPNNENRMYKVKDSYRFTVGGETASVHDLKKGMVISAEKIVEEPKAEITSNTTVTGHAPPPPAPRVEVAQVSPPERPRRAPVTEAAPAPTAAPTPAPVAPAAAAPAPREKLPAALPKTGSPLPLFGIMGLLFMGCALLLRRLNQE